MSAVADHVVEAIASVVAPPAPLHAPVISDNAWTYVKDCLDTGWVSTAGKHVERFEAMLCEFTGAEHAVAVVNGTAALHTAAVLIGVQPGDEVIVPTLSFVATANAFSHAGAIPHFVDSETNSFGIDPVLLRSHFETTIERYDGVLRNRHTKRRIAAVVVTHVFGMPAAVSDLRRVCDDFGLPLIEDAAESLGSFVDGRHTGLHGEIGCLSFNGNKIATTGGGGALLINDAALAAEARHLTTTAKKPHRWTYDHDRIGYNYRMPNINAALGCAQLENLTATIKFKRDLHIAYEAAFRDAPGVRFIETPKAQTQNHWLNAIAVNEIEERDHILQQTNDAGFMTRPCWAALHTLSMYRDAPCANVSVASNLCDRLINIPSGAGLIRA